jgi:hypothetical protein
MLRTLLLCLLLASLCLPLGCGGGPSIDWQSRIGAYTYADAEREYGPARGKQDLAEGRVMYVWYDERGTRRWKNVLSLIFDSSGKLQTIDKNER